MRYPCGAIRQLDTKTWRSEVKLGLENYSWKNIYGDEGEKSNWIGKRKIWTGLCHIFSRGSSPPRTEPVSLLSPALAAGFLTTARPGKPIFFPSLYINTTIYQSQQQCLTQQAFNKYLLNGCEYKQSEKLDVKTCSWSFFNLTLIWHPLYNSLSLLGETVLNVRAYLPPAIHMHIHSVTPIHAGSGWNPVSSRSTITPCSLCSNSQVPWDCSRCVTSYVTRAPFLTHL